MSRLLAIGLILGGLALLGVAAFDYFRPPDGPGVTIEEPERDYPAATAGQTFDVAFRVHNPTRHAARIVGLTEC